MLIKRKKCHKERTNIYKETEGEMGTYKMF